MFDNLKAPILVVGDIMLDHYVMGNVKRISPEAPVPVVSVKNENYTLGGCANVAHNLAGLEVPVHLFGSIGADHAAERLSNLCEEKGIHLKAFRSDYPTTLKTRIIGEHQQIVRVDFEEFFEQAERAIDQLNDQLESKSYAGIVLSDYGKGLCSKTFCQEVIQFAKAERIPTIVDPKGLDWDKYRGATVLTPNLLEFSQIVGKSLANEDAAIAQYGDTIRRRYDLQNLLVTRSEKGISWFSEVGMAHFPTEVIEVYDVSGAGDTVIAVITAMLAAGKNLKEAILAANKAGGYVVSKFGTYAINLEEFKRLGLES